MYIKVLKDSAGTAAASPTGRVFRRHFRLLSVFKYARQTALSSRLAKYACYVAHGLSSRLAKYARGVAQFTGAVFCALENRYAKVERQVRWRMR